MFVIIIMLWTILLFSILLIVTYVMNIITITRSLKTATAAQKQTLHAELGLSSVVLAIAVLWPATLLFIKYNPEAAMAFKAAKVIRG